MVWASDNKESMMKVAVGLVSILTLAAVLSLNSCSNPAGNLSSKALARSAMTGTVVSTQVSSLDLPFGPGILVAGDPSVQVNYTTPNMTNTNVFLHLGFNNWTTIQDVPLTGDLYQTGVAILSAKISLPLGTNEIEYCVYQVQADGTKVWDNNGGKNYVYSVTASAASCLDNVDGTRTVSYAGSMAPASIHWGVNGWTNVQNTAMNLSATPILPSGLNLYTVTISGLTSGETMNYCFTNLKGVWDNNNQQNWVSN
jgi:hypothetical protein